MEDFSTIVCPTGWLNDKIVQAGQLLLAKSFPDINGLQSPVLAQVSGFQIHREKFVQILNINFVTHTGLQFQMWVVRMVLSRCMILFTAGVSQKHLLEQSVEWFFYQRSAIEIQVMDVSPQTNMSDCGVLALALAYEICSQKNPCSVIFDHRQSRQHLVRCLQDSVIARFPIAGARRYKNCLDVEHIDLHCVCRMPYYDSDSEQEDLMVMCNKWFHPHCVNAHESELVSDEYHCPYCKKKKKQSLSL